MCMLFREGQQFQHLYMGMLFFKKKIIAFFLYPELYVWISTLSVLLKSHFLINYYWTLEKYQHIYN